MGTFERNVSALSANEFDVLIVGGGISGAWLALHCAQSGYRTALIEQADFASQTSSASSKLLHGGIRYLQQFQFGKVRESAMERAHFIHAAPHLSTAVPFLIPTYKDFARSKFFLSCGMLAYRLLTWGENRIIGQRAEHLPPISSLSATELNQTLDLQDQTHTGAIQFFERHMLNSERMVLNILQTAAGHGACIVNYYKAERLVSTNGCVSGVEAIDTLTKQAVQIKAKLVINAAGPWIDELNQQVTGKPPSINAFAVGSHIITRQISDKAIALTTKHQSNAKLDRGGRHVFLIPWNGYTLIGTSYDEITAPQRDLSPQQDHIQQLLEAVNDALPEIQLNSADVVSGYSGLYPLRTEDIQSTVYQGSGEYVILDHQDTDQIQGLITALGAKFTTGRKLSVLTLKQVHKKLGGKLNLSTPKLLSANYHSVEALVETAQQEYAARLPKQTINHLAKLYGSQLPQLMALCDENPSLLVPIADGQADIRAQLVFAARFEQAMSLADILFRRTAVGFFGISDEEIESAAAVVAPELQWSEPECAKQIQAVKDRLEEFAKTLRHIKQEDLPAYSA